MKTLMMVFLFFAMMACIKENDNYRSAGIITGVDVTMCGCCGGWIINIEDVRYLFDSMPENSGINLADETFPLSVKLDWQLVNNGCSNRITLQRIKKI